MAHEYRPMEQNRKSINRPNYIYKYIKQQQQQKKEQLKSMRKDRLLNEMLA